MTPDLRPEFNRTDGGVNCFSFGVTTSGEKWEVHSRKCYILHEDFALFVPDFIRYL